MEFSICWMTPPPNIWKKNHINFVVSKCFSDTSMTFWFFPLVRPKILTALIPPKKSLTVFCCPSIFSINISIFGPLFGVNISTLVNSYNFCSKDLKILYSNYMYKIICFMWKLIHIKEFGINLQHLITLHPKLHPKTSNFTMMIYNSRQNKALSVSIRSYRHTVAASVWKRSVISILAGYQ